MRRARAMRRRFDDEAAGCARRCERARGRTRGARWSRGAAVAMLVVVARVVVAQRVEPMKAPTVTWLEPPKGHVAGGTTLAVYGGGFLNSARLKVRFARGEETTEAYATYHSSTMITVVTPARVGAGWTQVTVANDGETWSGTPNVYTKGSGTFLAYVYDDSLAGFYDGVRQGENTNAYHELWSASNTTGPYIGGTIVRVYARNLDLGSNTLSSSATYVGPTDGAGSPNPNFPDPNAVMNSPPVHGTFYPGSKLTCRMTCNIDVNQDSSIASDGSETFVTAQPAIWHSYTSVECETPPMPVPVGDPIPSTACHMHISNDGINYDYANVTFTYADPLPTVTSISTAQSSVWGARGPFDGNTEVIVKGTNFLPSKYLKCKFGGIPESGKNLWESDDVSHVVGTPGGRVRWVSSTEIRCITPEFGPASQQLQYPAGSTLAASIWCCAVLDVTFDANNGISSTVTIVDGGRGYATAPVLTIIGGGGGGATATATIDSSGVVNAVTITNAGHSYNQGSGATATATLDASGGTLSALTLTAAGSGYTVPPDVTFSCSGGGDSCLGTHMQHARAVATLGPAANCFPEYGCYDKVVVSLRLTFVGNTYTSAPVVTISPQKPYVLVQANELFTSANDPPSIGAYTMQGKGETELDPQLSHGSWVDDGSGGRIYNVTDAPYDVVAVSGVPGANPGRRLYAVNQYSQNSPEDRGDLLAPLGQAGSDGSIKPAHQDLVQVSNNYNKFGVPVIGNAAATPTHVGYRDNTAAVKGYWMWSRSTGSASDCQVSNNPPLNFYDGTTLMGHNLDKGTGWVVAGSSNEYLGIPGNSDLGHPSKSCLYFLYGDIYVSPSGSDATGQGTAARPYATIQKCIDSALTDVRDYHVNAVGESNPSVPARISTQITKFNAGRSQKRDGGGGYAYTVNRDRCILKDGTYFGPGNRQLRANGRVIQLWAENEERAVIDCEGLPVGKQVYAKREPTRVSAPGSIATQGVVLKRCGFKMPYAAADKLFYPGRPTT